MTGDRPFFNLVREPWVKCQAPDGTIVELSLADVFARASEVRRLSGELPTQDYAVLRVLLAVLHRALAHTWSGGEPPVDWWGRLRSDSEGVRSVVRAYLHDWLEELWLFHPEHPFMQVADLRTATGKADGVGRLIADIPSGHQYFTMRAGPALGSLGCAEAARWTVHVQAFDPSGIKSGALGDPRVKNGKGYPIGTGWAGATGGVFAEGDSLWDTLMLNLVLGTAKSPLDDLPVWERAPLGPGVETRDAFERGGDAEAPTGPADLYTWQSRRVRLHREADRVVAVQVSNGDPLALQNMLKDPLTAYRFSKPQSAKFKTAVYMPRAHSPERLLWQGIPPLLVQSELSGTIDGAVAYRRPRVVDWISTLADYGELDLNASVGLRIVGVEYGSQSSTYADVLNDSLAVHVSLLAARSARLAVEAKGAADKTASAIAALGWLGRDLSRAAGNKDDTGSEELRRAAFSAVDAPYRRWVSRMDAQSDPEEAREEWNRATRGLLDALAREAVRQSGQSAMAGREVDGHFVSAPVAYLRFQRHLRSHLPVRADQEEKETANA